jgi:hypothetical protein
MAISGRLEADFSPFVAEAAKGNAALKSLETTSRTTEQALSEMTESVHGDQTAAEVDKMTAATDRLGKTATSTSTQLRLVKGAADDAAKSAQTISDTGAKVAQATDEITKGQKAAAGLSTALTDGANAARVLGVDLGPVEALIGEVTPILDAAATAATGLAAATAAVATAYGAWKIGTWIGEVTGLTDAVGRLAQAEGDLAAEQRAAAGPSAAVVAQRQKEAEAIIAANQALAKTPGQQLDELAAARAAKIQEETQAIRDDTGAYNELIDKINSGKFSQQEIATAYGLSTDAMKAFSAEAKIAAHNQEQLLNLRSNEAKADAQHEADQAAAEDARLKASGDYIDSQYKAAEAAKAKRDAELDAELQSKHAIDATTSALDAQAAAQRNVISAGNQITFDLSTLAGMRQFKELNPTADVGVGTDWFKEAGHTLAEAIAEGLITFRNPGFFSTMFTLGGSMSNSAYHGGAAPMPPPPAPPSGGTHSSGPAATPAAGGGGQPINIQANTYVSGVFDPASKDALGKVVKDAVAKSVTIARVVPWG